MVLEQAVAAIWLAQFVAARRRDHFQFLDDYQAAMEARPRRLKVRSLASQTELNLEYMKKNINNMQNISNM
jgi:hypothetical protein